jgi:uncharacterized membrane protein YjfL (UPF0719 family)
MFNKKLTVNYDGILKWISLGSIGLLILALCFKVRMLIIAAELFIFLSIMAMIFSAIYSLVSKHENENTKNDKTK